MLIVYTALELTRFDGLSEIRSPAGFAVDRVADSDKASGGFHDDHAMKLRGHPPIYNGLGPFAMKPLLLPAIGPTLAPTLQAMGNNAAATNPTGTATIN